MQTHTIHPRPVLATYPPLGRSKAPMPIELDAAITKLVAAVHESVLALNDVSRRRRSLDAIGGRVQLVTATPRVVYRQEFRIPRSSVDVD